MSHLQFSILAAGFTVGGLAVVVSGARLVLRFFPGQAKRLAISFLLIYVVTLLLRPSASPMIDLAVLTGAVGGVLLVEGGLRTPEAVAVFLAVAAIVDVWSMFGGLSRALVEQYRAGASNFLLYLTLVAPVHGRAVPIVGIGDLLVGGAAAAALLRLGFRPVYVMGAVIVGLLSALAYGLWRGGAPTLPFVATAVLILVWRYTGSASSRGREDV